MSTQQNCPPCCDVTSHFPRDGVHVWHRRRLVLISPGIANILTLRTPHRTENRNNIKLEANWCQIGSTVNKKLGPTRCKNLKANQVRFNDCQMRSELTSKRKTKPEKKSMTAFRGQYTLTSLIFNYPRHRPSLYLPFILPTTLGRHPGSERYTQTSIISKRDHFPLLLNNGCGDA